MLHVLLLLQVQIHTEPHVFFQIITPDRPLINKQTCALNTFLRVIRTWPQRGFTTRVQALHLSLGIYALCERKIVLHSGSSIQHDGHDADYNKKAFLAQVYKGNTEIQTKCSKCKVERAFSFFIKAKRKVTSKHQHLSFSSGVSVSAGATGEGGKL